MQRHLSPSLQQGFQERQANSSRAVCTENIDPLQPGYSTATSLSLSSCLGRGKATEPLMPHGQFRKRRDYDRGTLELLQKLRAQTWETNYLTDILPAPVWHQETAQDLTWCGDFLKPGPGRSLTVGHKAAEATASASRGRKRSGKAWFVAGDLMRTSLQATSGKVLQLVVLCQLGNSTYYKTTMYHATQCCASQSCLMPHHALRSHAVCHLLEPSAFGCL